MLKQVSKTQIIELNLVCIETYFSMIPLRIVAQRYEIAYFYQTKQAANITCYKLFIAQK